MDQQQQLLQSQSPLVVPGSVHSLQQDDVKVEDLPLDKKLDILKKYNPLDRYEEGRYIDCQDTVNAWCLGKIVQIDQRSMNIHFDGWSSRWDVWQKMNSYKVAPFRKQSRGYTGQIKVALRSERFNLDDLHIEKQKVEKLIESELSGLGAFETTQYLRGQLYIFVDFLLGSNTYTDEHIDAVNDFLYAVLRLIITYFKKVTKLLPLFSQIKVNSDLFLIDENIAIIQCYPDFMDILKKFFGLCHRAMRYYLLFDKNQVKFDQNVTLDYIDKNFEELRRKDEEDYDIDEVKQQISQKKTPAFGQLINFLNYFAWQGGFDAILDLLRLGNEAEEKIPLEWFSALTAPFKNCNLIFSQSFSQSFVQSVRDLIFNRIKNMSEKELKELDKEAIGRLLNDIKDFLLLSLSEIESAELIESTQLFTALRFLKSTYLEKRLKGLNDIKYMIDRIEAGIKLQQKQQQQQQQDFKINRPSGNIQDQDMIGGVGGFQEGFKVKPMKYLTPEAMKNWLLDQKILEIVFGESTHLEIVKRTGSILKFLAKQDALPLDTIELVWKCQLGKHEEMVRVVFNIINDLLPFLSKDNIDGFYTKIQTVPALQFDEKFLIFLKEFTIKALEHYYDQKNEECGMSEIHSDDFDEICAKKERKVLENIQTHINSQIKGLDGDEQLYGLPIFWELIQDKATISVTQELLDISINSLTEILKQSCSKHIRFSFLLRSIENLAKLESVIQSVTVAGHIISEFPEQEFKEGSLTQAKVIELLQKQVDIVGIIIKNIVQYQTNVRDKVKTMSEKKKVFDDAPNSIFVGRFNHEISLNKLLDFLEFLIINSNQNDVQIVSLGTDNIDILWKNFVQQPNFNTDQNFFLRWINKPRESQYNPRHELFLFTDDEKKYFFTKILCNPTYVNSKISIGQVKCFHKYFKVINRQEDFIEAFRGRRLKVKNYGNLLGLDTLWKISIESENEKVREESMDLLVDLHLKFDLLVELDEQKKIWYHFIEECMKNIDDVHNPNIVQNTILLLSRFLDRYEGKKTLKPEMKFSQQFSNIQPMNVTVVNRTDQQRKQVNVSYFQTIGYLRQKIAETWDYHINEFIMNIKNQFVDPEDDDDKYIKDCGMFSQVVIQKDPQYSPENHPKYLISGSQAYFDKLFLILSQDDTTLIEPTWELLQKLPISQKLQLEIKELSGVMDDKNIWNKILDPKSTYKLLYSLNIIRKQYFDQKTDPKEIQKSNSWKYKFQQMGGFSHLLNTFVHLEVKSIDTFLTLKCIENLITTIMEFLLIEKKNQDEVQKQKEDLFLKCFYWLDLISDYTIKSEKKRNGDSLEEIQRRITQNKQKKNKYKSYMQGNKQDNKQQEDDDDNDSQDSTLWQAISKQLQEEGIIVQTLFKFINTHIIPHDINIVILLNTYPNIENLLRKSTLQSENYILRQEVAKRVKEYISQLSRTPQILKMLDLIKILLFKLTTNLNLQYESRALNFFELIPSLLEYLSSSDISSIEPQIKELMFQIKDEIMKREIKEKNTSDVDFLLQGKMKLLKVILQRFPLYKQQIGQNLLHYLLHDCLFEIPQGSATKATNKVSSPKTKSMMSRQAAIRLIAVLCRDCLFNLNIVLDYMHKFNQNSSWRTNKDHDWNISLMDSEKSSTGYVGIKNLGCICYMNSLHQQIFAIPTLRNDILSVRDPKFEQQDKDENMLYQLQLLFAGLLKSEKQYVNPKGFCHSFKDWEGQPTNVLEQMDVEEFFQMFMDRLETAIKGTPQEKTIQYHFGGKYANEIICRGCPHTYERQEPFLSLSVPVKNKKSIIEGMNTFISGDMLEGENSYFCEKCDKKVDALKRTCIKRLPRYLTIALKRFEFDFDKMARAKVNDYCEFPMELNMSEFTQEGLARREKQKKLKEERGEDTGAGSNSNDLEDNKNPSDQEPLKYPNEYYEYKLTGVVVHSGTADSGHYYSFIADREHPESGKWYEMNDHIVREFDPNDIPQECFGGEDSFQGYNMVQMKTMKWRNAYILIYERKVPIEVQSEEEEEKASSKNSSSLQEDVEMKTNQLSILQEIEEKIAYENQKYWQNRFLFSAEYHEFVYDVSLNWNTSCLIPKKFLTKNDDFHIYNQSKPQEYFQDDNINEPVDEKINLLQLHKPEEIEKQELAVFKFAAQFYLTILQRAMNKIFIPQMLNLLKSYMNKNVYCSEWLLSEFCNTQIIEEILLQSSTKEMRKFVVGLLYCAMLKIYEKEKDRLNLYWKKNAQGLQPSPTNLGNFILIIIRHLYDTKRFVKNFAQYFQLLARFSSLGPEAREFLLRARMVGRLMDFLFENSSPYKEEFRNMLDIVPTYNENPDIGLPTQIDKKQISQYQEMMEKRRMKLMAEAPPRYKFLLETMSNLIRSCKFGPNKTPYQLDDLNYDTLESQETDLFIPEPKFLKKVFQEAKKGRSIKAVCKAYLHYSFQDQEKYFDLLRTVLAGLLEFDYDEVKPFLILFQFLLQKPQDKHEYKLDTCLSHFLDAIRQNANFFKFMETMFDFIFKITSRNEFVRDWFYAKRTNWEWLIEWVKEYKLPPNPIAQNSSIKLFKKRSNINQLQLHQQMYKMDSQRGQLMNSYRSRRLQQMLDQSIPDLSIEIDIDLEDMQDHKFCYGEQVDFYTKKSERAIPYIVELVLDEMIHMKSLTQSNDSYQNNLMWISCDTDKLLRGGVYRNLYRTKLLENIHVQLERRRIEGSNPQPPGQRPLPSAAGQGPNNGQDQDDEMDTGAAGGHASENDEEDDEGENIYT